MSAMREEHAIPKPKEDGARTAPSGASIDWTPLVESIRAGDDRAMAQLYAVFGRGMRYFLFRQVGVQEIEDKIHDTFVITINAIRRGDLREPERIMGFVRTVVRRLVAGHINQLMDERKEHADVEEVQRLIDERIDPEKDVIAQQRTDLMMNVLRSLPKRDRNILTRFYLQEQTQEQICKDMGLTETQFRLLKSRAKARFGELGKQRLEKAKTSENKFLRKIAGA